MKDYTKCTKQEKVIWNNFCNKQSLGSGICTIDNKECCLDWNDNTLD